MDAFKAVSFCLNPSEFCGLAQKASGMTRKVEIPNQHCHLKKANAHSISSQHNATIRPISDRRHSLINVKIGGSWVGTQVFRKINRPMDINQTEIAAPRNL